jgi:hypothetical protein
MALPMTASAQDQLDLGDEFIVFVEGKNVLVPFFDGTAVADPTDASNTVASSLTVDGLPPVFVGMEPLALT